MSGPEIPRCAGPACNRPLTRLGTGRRPVYCGPNCRKAAQRERDRRARAEQERGLQLAEAQATAARAWRPLEETARDAEELAAAVLAYVGEDDGVSLAAKLAEFRQAAQQLEELALTYSDAVRTAARLTKEQQDGLSHREITPARSEPERGDLMTQARTALHLDVPCPRCGAGFSQPCQTTAGAHIMPPQVHTEREAAWKAAHPRSVT